MRIGMPLSYSGGFKQTVTTLSDYENAGLDLVTVAEAYSFDAVSQLGYIAAVTQRLQIASGILPIYTRTPTLTAMTAAGLDYVSDGRFVLGIGASGPQVIEGFHGVRYDAPLARTREIVQICRQVWRRERVHHEGQHYQIPLPAGRGTGLGKPLKLINYPVRERIPVMLAAIGTRNVALAAEIAEGWQPFFFDPRRAGSVWGEALAEGRARRDPSLGKLDIIAPAALAIGEHTDEMIDAMRPMLALYIGGMGARGKNFYHDLAVRYGYREEADVIQDLYLAGNRDKAAAAVPAELIRSVSLIGPEGFVRDQLAALADAGVTTITVTPLGDSHEQRLRLLERLRQMID
jgi:F420-dependent oxidoreductase-like protein